MATKTFNAPLAVIKFNGIAIGKMRDITLTETINRGTVRGIGAFTPDDLPALTWDGTMNCGMYLIDFGKAMNYITSADNINGAPVLQRNVSSPQEFVDTVLLQEEGVVVDILRRVKDTQDTNTGVIKAKLEIFASIRGAFLTRESMNISESQIGGRNADFSYTNPVIFSV